MTTNGRWQDMFDHSRNGGNAPGAPPPIMDSEMPREQPPDDDGLALDLSVYKPWILQRGRSRPAMMLDFRRYEPRSGLWSGWAIAYPHLIGMEYTGDQMLSLDFGKLQVMIVGSGLGELVRHLQYGAVISLREYSQSVWPLLCNGSVIRSIAKIE